MHSDSESSYRMKVFPKGQVVIPVALRKKYRIEIGDQIEVVADKMGILLKTLPKSESTNTLTDQLYGIFAKFSKGKKALSQNDIQHATKIGFGEGWEK